ncbi:MAG: SET domain-containing protein, partial [Nanoarchaeota archaeon]|nr:SET domain-containing protein [Nanoarchaeota archaeon]
MKNVIIKKAGKNGEGTFASRNFKKDDNILCCSYRKIKKAKIVHRKDIQKLSKKDQNHLDFIGRNQYVVDYSHISKINHSCNPNSYVKYKNIKEKCIIALKAIKKGEEITVDYATSAIDAWTMKCHCKSKKCRKIIYGDY